MKVSFELSASDIRYFRDRLKQVRKSVSPRNEPLVIRSRAEDPSEIVGCVCLEVTGGCAFLQQIWN